MPSFKTKLNNTSLYNETIKKKSKTKLRREKTELMENVHLQFQGVKYKIN